MTASDYTQQKAQPPNNIPAQKNLLQQKLEL